MDTLSRKHRLRQRQQASHQLLLLQNNLSHQHQQQQYQLQKQQQQQGVHSDREHYLVTDYRLSQAGHPMDLTFKTQVREENRFSSDDDEFKVYKVVDLRRVDRLEGNAQQVASSVAEQKIWSHTHGSHLVSDRTLHGSSKQLHSCNESTRSTGDSVSSGFLSEGNPGGGSGDLSRKTEPNELFEELDRLILHANCSSPTESYVSGFDSGLRDSTLIRAREMEHSFRCADEFSSFIEATQSCLEQHHYEPSQLHQQTIAPLEPRMDRPGNRWLIKQASPDSASELGLSSDRDLEEETLELEMDVEMAERQLNSLSSSSRQFATEVQRSRCDLGQMLELHSRRVEWLLRLSSGKGAADSINSDGYKKSPIEAEWPPEGDEICMGEEEQTKIEFTPLQQTSASINWVQQVETVEWHDHDYNRHDDTSRGSFSPLGSSSCDSLISAISFHLGAHVSHDVGHLPPPDIQLNWDEERAHDTSFEMDALISRLASQKGALQSSLLDRLTCLLTLHDEQPSIGVRQFSMVVMRHLSDFLDGYVKYQRELQLNTSFSSDWHQNWLFAPKWQAEQLKLDRKRASLLEISLQASDSCLVSCQDLLRYSSLILNRYKPVKLIYPITECDASLRMELYYEAQKSLVSELEFVVLESKGQLDACRYLLSPREEEDEQKVKSRGKRGKIWKVNYACSDCLALPDGLFRFEAFGYVFETPIRVSKKVSGQIENRLREQILKSFGSRLLKIGNFSGNPVSHEDKARFLVDLDNVELINRLPVIQFCAKIAGRQPMRVRWFRNDSEISDITKFGNVRHLTLDTDTSHDSQWPLTWHAIHDFEYKTEWGSQVRFRRHHSDIMFELRNANFDLDYNVTYRCQIENYCSQDECSFTLSHRRIAAKPTRDLNNNNNNSNRNENCHSGNEARKRRARCYDEQETGALTDGRALLRTWSQRTLKKPLGEAQEQQVAEESQVEFAGKSWHHTLGRLSGTAALDEDRFGEDFVYHPKNLMKRLEENKFCLVAKLRATRGLKSEPEQVYNQLFDHQLASKEVGVREKNERTIHINADQHHNQQTGHHFLATKLAIQLDSPPPSQIQFRHSKEYQPPDERRSDPKANSPQVS